MSQLSPRQFIVYGNTLAASTTILALTRALPVNVELIWVKPPSSCPSEMLYGGITSPEAYQFNLKQGISEPQLILNTDTTFSFGSHFYDWGEQGKTWMQCFHLPFDATSGAALHHFMTRHKRYLGDFLISAQAAIKGTFAHPPVDNLQSPLSRAEYGYHFDPAQWSAVFYDNIDTARVKIINSDITEIDSNEGTINCITLEEGTTLQAELYIDCSGTSASLISTISDDYVNQRKVHLQQETLMCEKTGPARRDITGTAHGWTMLTPLRNSNVKLSLYEDEFADDITDKHSFSLGHKKEAWHGNCVAIGHAAYALEPVTTAPYILLQKDITRLLELIPVGANTHIERIQYNRQFQDDVKHAELFHHAMYAGQRNVGFKKCEKLERKLTQYAHRGVLAAYDFEPFNEQDWAILHAGLGRVPEHYDLMANQSDFTDMEASLNNMGKGMAHLASKMPVHHIYLQKLSAYLLENNKRGE